MLCHEYNITTNSNGASVTFGFGSNAATTTAEVAQQTISQIPNRHWNINYIVFHKIRNWPFKKNAEHKTNLDSLIQISFKTVLPIHFVGSLLNMTGSFVHSFTKAQTRQTKGVP